MKHQRHKSTSTFSDITLINSCSQSFGFLHDEPDLYHHKKKERDESIARAVREIRSLKSRVKGAIDYGVFIRQGRKSINKLRAAPSFLT